MTSNILSQQSEHLAENQTQQQAVALHQAGQLLEAGELYRSVLEACPNHPEANHNMGALAVQMQQPAAGLPYFMAALDADPARAQYWLSYIDALFQANQLEDARQVMDLARQQGLEGEEVDALALRLEEDTRIAEQAPVGEISVSEEPGPVPPSAPQDNQAGPSPQEFNTLVVLFNEGRFAEAATLAQGMTRRFPMHWAGWKMLGVVLKQLGRSAEALAPMQKAADLLPHDAEAHNNLGITLQDLGRLDEAEATHHKALLINPECAETLNNLGATLQGLGRMNEAEACYRRAIQISPDYAMAYNNLGATLQEMARLGEAEAILRQAIQIRPDYAEAHYNLGVVLKGLGRTSEAEAACRQAIQIKPDYADAHFNLGNIFHDLGRLDEAEASYQQALRINPDYAKAYNNLSNTLVKLGQLSDAEAICRHVLQTNQDCADTNYNLATILTKQNRLDEAEASYRRALQINPDYLEAHNNLVIILLCQGKLDECVSSYRRVLEIKPGCADTHHNLANCLRDLGQLDEAVASYHRVLEIEPEYAAAHSNLIFAQDLAADISIPTMQEERKKWGEAHAAHLPQRIPHSNNPDPERRLRIGYVSSDFSTNSAPTVFGTMLFNFDRSRFDVFAYSNETWTTALKQRFQKSVTCWRNIYGQADDDVADLIQQDKIDILVDLSGHSRENRLTVFARKPAPIQITAWGYATGTGMQAMDILFSDQVIIPPEETHLYTEKVKYLPSFLTYTPYQAPPKINELPALSTKSVTFCSFSRLEKISNEAYQTWAKILLSVPNSRILFKNYEMGHARVRDRVIGHFSRAGVSPERVILLGKSAWADHMAAFNQVDIALDPFPQGGGVTSLEGFLMGIPVITLRWPTFAGRTGASLLTTLGLTDWIAETPEQYIEIAIQKAQDITSLAELRQQMRERLTSSLIGDAHAYAKVVEQEYRQLWREWCSQNRDKNQIKNRQF